MDGRTIEKNGSRLFGRPTLTLSSSAEGNEGNGYVWIFDHIKLSIM
jgi:hypothetical protein